MRALFAALLWLTGCGTPSAAATAAATETPAVAAPAAPAPPAPAPPRPAAPTTPAVADPAAPPEVPHPYHEGADARAEIAAAVAAAHSDGKRVLVVFGANWCPWCRRLEHTLTLNPEVARAVGEGFHVVHVDTGARRSGVNAAIDDQYGNPISNGLPVIVVLDGDGHQVLTQETGALEDGDRHSPTKVLDFLHRVRS